MAPKAYKRTKRNDLKEKPFWELMKVFGAKIKNEVGGDNTWSINSLKMMCDSTMLLSIEHCYLSI